MLPTDGSWISIAFLRSFCLPSKTVGHVGRLGQGVGHLVRGQGAGILVREQAVDPPRCPGRWPRTAVGLGGGDRPDQVAEVELVGDEVAGQGVEQFGVDGRVGPRQVVGRVGDPLAEELGPGPVGHRPGEERVAWGRHPVGELGPGVLRPGGPDDLAAEDLGLGRLAGPEVLELAVGVDLDQGLGHHPHARAAGPLNLGEGGGQAEVVVLGPDVERVVVALGAADPEAEEPLGGLLGGDLGVDPLEGVGHGARAIRRVSLGSPTAVRRVRTSLSQGVFSSSCRSSQTR